MTDLLALAKRLKAQQKNSKNKVYAIHAPEVACIAKGKARNPYEFGAKVSIAVTAKDSWVVGARTFKGNPYDGHTLEEAFDQIKAITDHIPKHVYVDRGYRAAYLGQQTDVIITGQKRRSKATKRWMKRRNSVEPIIGHLKAEHKMQRNWLKCHGITPPWRHHGSGTGSERFQFEEDLESLGSFCAQNLRVDYGVVG